MMYEYELYHHGIKGQRWGVRNYQYADGSLTPAGRQRYGYGKSSGNKARIVANQKVSNLVNTVKYKATGKQYVDSYLSKGTTFARIQSSKDFENFAFYATYKKQDMDKYMGLFGKTFVRERHMKLRKRKSRLMLPVVKRTLITLKKCVVNPIT